MSFRHLLTALAIVVACGWHCLHTGAQEPAELVIQGGKIVTLDDAQPTVQALAARGDRIVAIGSREQIRPLIGPDTRVIDLQGQLAVPGFIEGHGHFMGLGRAKIILDHKSAKTWDDIVRQVEAAARNTPAGEWILGRGWHQSKWNEAPKPNVDGYPTHTKLSEVTPRHPVLLTHASGHMSFANKEAMRLAGIDANTKDPPGGEILRDEQGNPTGVFRETAQGLLSRARSTSFRRRTAAQIREETNKAVELATQECLRYGITSFQDAGSSFDTIDLFKSLADQGKLKVRLWVMVRDGNARMARQLAAYRMVGHGNNFLTVRAIKRSIDGALGPHGAWLLLPYEDMPSSAGLNTASIESVTETAGLAVKHDYQLCVHAIGDRANRETLNIFERAWGNSTSGRELRWRVEHAQHIHPDDIPRFGRLGVIASMQGIHCTSDAIFVIQRLGPRRAQSGAYVWQSLMKSGAIVTNGTDAPVEDLSPIDSYYATVTRKLPSGVEFYPAQKMTRMEALRSYTINNAYAAFEEDIKGSLSVGKLADIAVLSKDILTVPDDEIPKARVVTTIIGGRVAYEAVSQD